MLWFLQNACSKMNYGSAQAGFLAIFLAAVPAHAQDADHSESRDSITLTHGSPPRGSFLENTFATICDGVYFRITLLREGQLATLTEFTRNGRPVAREKTAELQRVLAQSGGAQLTGFRCYGAEQVVIGLTGSYFDPPEGEDDDYHRRFIIDFAKED